MIDHTGWRAACLWLGILVLALPGPINLLLKRQPEDIGHAPDGRPGSMTGARAANIVAHAWVAIDWTLTRALHTPWFWWIALGY